MKKPVLISFPNSETHSLVNMGHIPADAVCWSFSMERNSGGKWEILLSWVNQEVHKIALATYTSEELACRDMNSVTRSIRKSAREQANLTRDPQEQAFGEIFEREGEAS
jgi:hypothetical protein